MSAAGPRMKGAQPQGWPGRTLTGMDKSFVGVGDRGAKRESLAGSVPPPPPCWLFISGACVPGSAVKSIKVTAKRCSERSSRPGPESDLWGPALCSGTSWLCDPGQVETLWGFVPGTPQSQRADEAGESEGCKVPNQGPGTGVLDTCPPLIPSLFCLSEPQFPHLIRVF